MDRIKTTEFIRNYSKLGLKVYSFRQQWFEEIAKIPSPWNEMMNDFKPHIEKFLRLIMLDKEVDKLAKKNRNQRFSAVIRFLIKKYNEAREPKIMEEIRLRKENSS